MSPDSPAGQTSLTRNSIPLPQNSIPFSQILSCCSPVGDFALPCCLPGAECVHSLFNLDFAVCETESLAPDRAERRLCCLFCAAGTVGAVGWDFGELWSCWWVRNILAEPSFGCSGLFGGFFWLFLPPPFSGRCCVDHPCALFSLPGNSSMRGEGSISA